MAATAPVQAHALTAIEYDPAALWQHVALEAHGPHASMRHSAQELGEHVEEERPAAKA